MNICIWTNSIFKLGGTKRVITTVVNELVKTNDITIMCYDKPEEENYDMYNLNRNIKVDYLVQSEYEDRKRSIPKYYRSVLRRMNDGIGFLNTPRKVEKLKNAVCPAWLQNKWIKYLNEKNYDVIIATAGHALTLSIISERLNAKTVGWQHNCYDTYVLQKNVLFWKKEELLKKYLPKLDKYVVLNEYDKIDFKEKLDIECVAMDNPRSFVSEKKTDLDQKCFFVAARFVKAKGLDLLIKAFAKFCEVDNEWQLVIAGDGKERKKVLDFVWKNKVQDRVRFIGTTNNVEKYYLQSSIYLLSSRWEGWGLVIVEAFEFGMPVISFDIVPVDLIITNGEDGILVNMFDVDAFAAAMVKLAHDDALRKKMGAKAIDKAEQFSEKLIAAKWEQMLKDL